MDSLRFRSRVDLWLVAIIAIPLVVAFAATASQAWSHGPGAILAVIVGNAFALGLVVWIFVDTSYTFTESELRIRCGPMRSTVALSAIQRVRHSDSLLSAPALSLRRLELDGRGGVHAVISPDDVDGFLAALQARVPGVVGP
jgi:membrane protein YdbS with pleckstrin-like domain